MTLCQLGYYLKFYHKSLNFSTEIHAGKDKRTKRKAPHFIPRKIPSVYKGQYGFSGQKHREAVLSSLPGASPAASSAWLPRRFCSRKAPQDLPAGKNQGWQGRRTKVGLISHQGRERSQRSFWLLLAYCPLYTEGRLTRDREKPVLEDKILLILGEKPRHTAIASFEGALWREKSRFSGDLSLSRVSLVEIWNKKKRKEERKTNFLLTQKGFLIYNSNLQGYQTRVTSARSRAEKI